MANIPENRHSPNQFQPHQPHQSLSQISPAFLQPEALEHQPLASIVLPYNQLQETNPLFSVSNWGLPFLSKLHSEAPNLWEPYALGTPTHDPSYVDYRSGSIYNSPFQSVGLDGTDLCLYPNQSTDIPLEIGTALYHDLRAGQITSFVANNNFTVDNLALSIPVDSSTIHGATQLHESDQYPTNQYQHASTIASELPDIQRSSLPDVPGVLPALPLNNQGMSSDSNVSTAAQAGREVPQERFRCYHRTCKESFDTNARRDVHRREAHPDLRFECHECRETFASPVLVGNHAAEKSHAAFVCDAPDCLASFTRLDTYDRHRTIHEDNGKRFTCPHCRKHRGTNGFKRKDHLTQHLRNYHNMELNSDSGALWGRSCPHESCPEYRSPDISARSWDERNAFKKASDFTKHMKKVHDESPYPCPELGCDRFGGKGYFRKRDLVKHQQKEHAKGADEAAEDGEA